MHLCVGQDSSSQLAEPLGTDRGLKREIRAHRPISKKEKKKKRKEKALAGNDDSSNLPQKTSNAKK